MSFQVNTQQFEGPLDLMLHLIKEHELDLFDLDISVLADQYLSYLNQMEHLHLEVESEYLVELATLIEYKSRKLLPKDDSKLEAEYEEDPHGCNGSYIHLVWYGVPAAQSAGAVV